MNARQRAFSLEYAKSPNATQAAISAGYSPRTAYSMGGRLLKNVEVINLIKQLQAEADAERIAQIGEIRAFWTTTMRNTEERTETRIKASELLAKAAGAFLQRIEVEADVDLEAEVEGGVVFYLPENGRTIITDESISDQKER